jgi:GNAT superfamily N-acetyltransferase
MSKVESCVFFDEKTATEIPVQDFKVNFFVLSIPKKTNFFGFQVGKNSQFQFKVIDAKINEYFVKAVCKCISDSPSDWHFCITASATPVFQKRKVNDQWLFSEKNSQITLFGQHPWYISFPISFVLKDYNHEIILMECTKGTNLVYLSGLVISLKVYVPNRDVSSIEIEVEDIFQVDQKIIFQARARKISKKLKEAFSLQFLEGEPKASFARLKAAGLHIPSFKGRVQFVPVSTSEDYKKVLSLRRFAYMGKITSKISADATLEHFSDEFDRYASVMALKLGSEVIATGRSVFNFGDLHQSEIFRLGFTPPEFIKKDGFVEASRFATHSEYRGQDLFHLLLSFAFRSAILTGHRYILADCEDHLLPIYRKWGAKVFDEKVIHHIEKVKLNVVYFDLHKTIKRAKFYFSLPFIPDRYKKTAEDILQLSRDPIHGSDNYKTL